MNQDRMEATDCISAPHTALGSHLISPFESGLCRLAAFFYRLYEDAESSLAAALYAEVKRRLPGRLLQSDLPPLRLGRTRYVQQP